MSSVECDVECEVGSGSGSESGKEERSDGFGVRFAVFLVFERFAVSCRGTRVVRI